MYREVFLLAEFHRPAENLARVLLTEEKKPSALSSLSPARQPRPEALDADPEKRLPPEIQLNGKNAEVKRQENQGSR